MRILGIVFAGRSTARSLELGLEADEVTENERFRYLHFTAPDGNTYELVEALRKRDASSERN